MRTYLRVRANRADEVTGEVVREQPLTLWVNGEKFLTLLCSPIKLEALVVAEDVGRHSAVDKVKGEALTRGIPTEGRILLSTGRVSSEMLLKAARMGVPLVASRTSPTEMAVALAEQLNVTVCGYVRGDSLNLYAGSALLLGEEAMATRRPPRRRRPPGAGPSQQPPHDGAVRGPAPPPCHRRGPRGGPARGGAGAPRLQPGSLRPARRTPEDVAARAGRAPVTGRARLDAVRLDAWSDHA